MQQVLNCIDAGTEYCPCFLAETGECLMCSQLQGKTFCDCRNWNGVCIYQEYVSNRSQMKEHRKTLPCRILKRDIVSDSVIILKIQVNKTLARELSQPGAYVFLRNTKDPDYFDAPMSIMSVDEREGTIEVAIQIKGAKTRALDELNTTDVSLRGPYWNGVLGLKYIKMLQKQKALIITRGVGQAPAVAVAKKLIHAGNHVEVILDQGRAGVNFAERYFRELGCEIQLKPVLNLKTLTLTDEINEYIRQSVLENGIKLVYSSGTDKIHQGICSVLQAMAPDVFFACSNGASFCCGEGICGSCQTRMSDGTRIKTCKTQLNPVEIYGRR